MVTLGCKEIDGNKNLLGKTLKLVKAVTDSDIEQGEVAICVGIEDFGEGILATRMERDGTDYDIYAYGGEEWVVVPEEKIC
jgi:hypothetical protein